MNVVSLDEDIYHAVDSNIVNAILSDFSGKCDLCNIEPPAGLSNVLFFEAHYITWLSQGGRNEAANIAVLCPNCHKKIHLSFNENDLDRIKEKAKDRAACFR